MSRGPEEILDEIGRLIDLQIKVIASMVESGSSESAWRERDERQLAIDALFLELEHAHKTVG
jgi:hypothetical protein